MQVNASNFSGSPSMTLNVSLRVPDGIVLASDSLSTLTEPINQKLTVSGTCDGCGKQVEIRDVQAPPIAVPSSTWPYTQKLFPIAERFGLATYGSAFVNGRSIYNHVIELTPKLPKPGNEERQQLTELVTKLRVAVEAQTGRKISVNRTAGGLSNAAN